jgi:hypothetical protein
MLDGSTQNIIRQFNLKHHNTKVSNRCHHTVHSTYLYINMTLEHKCIKCSKCSVNKEHKQTNEHK